MEDQREALEDGVRAVFCVVEPQVPMRVDQLHALPEIIRSSVRLGIHRGAAAALASVWLRTGVHLGGIDPGFPETSSAATRCGPGAGRPVGARRDCGRARGRPADALFFILFNCKKCVSAVPRAVRAAWVNIWGVHHVRGAPDHA